MKTRLLTLTAALVACTTPAWAAAALPTHETYSAAAELGTNFFTGEPYISQSDITSTPGEVASIPQNTGGIPSYLNYSASASTNFGSNHGYAQARALPLGSLGIGSFSGWYDQVTISGGTGTGTMQFQVRLNGEVRVGAIAGGAAYGLFASSFHPTQLIDTSITFNVLRPATQPWALDAPLGYGDSAQVTTITSYAIGASPYNDATVLFTDQPLQLTDDGLGIPSLTNLKSYADLVITPGSTQGPDVTLHGTLTFTYGEAFYLISGLGTSLFDGLVPFCDFAIGECSAPQKEGTGATTLDFSNSANLVGIVLPEGASASFGSGATYNVTAVPEPGMWVMLLAGLGLVAGAARRRI